MKIRYTGPAAEVSLAPAVGGLTFRKGEVVEVDDEVGRSLVRQGTFERVREPRPRSESSAARTNPDVESR